MVFRHTNKKLKSSRRFIKFIKFASHKRILLSFPIYGIIKHSLSFVNSYIINPSKNKLYTLYSTLSQKYVCPSASISAQMDRARALLHADFPFEDYTGKNIGIAILDTGISTVNDFLLPYPRITAFKDFVNGQTEPYDDNGHGTHVAGIACGNGYDSDGQYRGIAPQSNIISVKILDNEGEGNTATALAGIQWAIENSKRYNIRILNLSIGSKEKFSNFPLIQAVNSAWDKGIVVVAASGNEVARSNQITAPGISPKILTVGILENGIRRQAFLSGGIFNRKKYYKPDIFAPGHNIMSCLSPEYSYKSRGRTKKSSPGQYIEMSGTSMSTPMISGACALLLEKYPNLSPNEVKRLIIKSSLDEKGRPQVLDIEKLLRKEGD